MTRRAVWTWAAMGAAALLSGCIVIDVGHDSSWAPSTADVTFHWDCGSPSACARAGIDEVEIDIWSGSQLVVQTIVAGDATAATLHSLEPGDYTYTITAASRGQGLYRASASFSAYAGDNAYELSLSYVGR